MSSLHGFRSCRSAALSFVFSLIVFVLPAQAAEKSSVIRGLVTDPAGAVVTGAKVELLRGSTVVAGSSTDSQGNFELSAPQAGRYHLRTSAAGFAQQESAPFYVGAGKPVRVEVALHIGTIAQQIVVSATGTETPDSRIGASVSVITDQELANRLDLLEMLPQVPGVQLVQQAERGSLGSLFIRGGNSNASKVLLDGVPLNEIGGTVHLGLVSTTGVEQLEVLRGPNSVLYGSDAMAGVMSITTRRGATPLPQLEYAFDAGNFSSLHHDVSLAGAFHRLDYLGEFSRFDTGNSIPNSTFHNGTFVANLGLAINPATELRLTGRYTTAANGNPNAFEFFGIPDDSFQRDQDGYLGLTFQNQTTSRWHNQVRYAATRIRRQAENPTPSGIPFDNGFGFGLNFLGLPVTIKGANGFSATGQAILDFGGVYPSTNSSTNKSDSVYIQSDYSVNSHLLLLGGFRYENERGFSLISSVSTPVHRGNFSYIAEAQGSLGSRAYATLGGSIENNAVFGVAAVPRASLAYYAIRPRSDGFFNGTKLKFNYGQGIKEPSIFEATESLAGFLSALPNGNQLISQFKIGPISAERSRSYDFGFEQLAWHGRARLGETFFYNQFTNQIEFVPSTALFLLGIPPAAVPPSIFGAFFNSGDTRALGAETELEVRLGHGFAARAQYTYLDEVLQRSSTGDAFNCSQPGQLFCAFNPAFPTIPIGAFSPLVGSRPFRRAPHTGAIYLSYVQPRFTLALNGLFISRRDDSTFLSDGFFGNTLLLPNRNLDPGYQKIDLSGSFRVNRRLTFYSVVENVLSQHYDQVLGFPALPLTFRSGFRITLGGENWSWH
jgi:iron complex outermembrane receptor protein/vitamin B12 transporter